MGESTKACYNCIWFAPFPEIDLCQICPTPSLCHHNLRFRDGICERKPRHQYRSDGCKSFMPNFPQGANDA